MSRIVAIDGPGGSGKSTVARRVAERLGWSHLDTGAFYRAATVAVLRAGIDPEDSQSVLASLTGRVFSQEPGVMLLDGEDVSVAIRQEDVTAAVSAVSAHPEVRRLLVGMQRDWVAEHPGGAVVEGRDIGTVVFPDALLKVYLDADPVVRARRRAGETGELTEEVMAALRRRDRLDSSRAASPLEAAADAVVVDTTEMGIDDVVGRVIGLVERRLST